MSYIKIFLNKFIAVSLLLVFFTSSCISKKNKPLTSTTSMTNQEHYPRIEIYAKKPIGNPNSGQNSTTLSNGITEYGGDSDSRIVIVKNTFLIKEQQKNKLMQLSLRRFTFFDTQTENINLQTYFDALKGKNRDNLHQLLPKNLDAFSQKKLTDSNYPYYDTLLNYETANHEKMAVIWLDEKAYYVDNIYFSTDSALNEFLQNGDEMIISNTDFKDFLRTSPLFQDKITEGFSN